MAPCWSFRVVWDKGLACRARTCSPRAPLWGWDVLVAAEAQPIGLLRKGQAGPISAGAKIPGTSSALWVQVVVLVGSGEFCMLWEPRNSADPNHVPQDIGLETNYTCFFY